MEPADYLEKSKDLITIVIVVNDFNRIFTLSTD